VTWRPSIRGRLRCALACVFLRSAAVASRSNLDRSGASNIRGVLASITLLRLRTAALRRSAMPLSSRRELQLTDDSTVFGLRAGNWSQRDGAPFGGKEKPVPKRTPGRAGCRKQSSRIKAPPWRDRTPAVRGRPCPRTQSCRRAPHSAWRSSSTGRSPPAPPGCYTARPAPCP